MAFTQSEVTLETPEIEEKVREVCGREVERRVVQLHKLAAGLRSASFPRDYREGEG